MIEVTKNKVSITCLGESNRLVTKKTQPAAKKPLDFEKHPKIINQSIFSRSLQIENTLQALCDVLINILAGVKDIFCFACEFIGASLRFSASPTLYIATDILASDKEEDKRAQQDADFFIGFIYVIFKMMQTIADQKSTESDSE